MGLSSSLKGCEKSRPHKDSPPWTVQPVASHCTHYAVPAQVIVGTTTTVQ